MRRPLILLAVVVLGVGATHAQTNERFRGRLSVMPVAFALDVTSGVNGTLAGTIDLTAAETEILREAGYYVQIHTEHNRGGELRGWLMAARP